MSKTLKVGNLAVTMTAVRLEEICSAFGGVKRVRMAESPLSGKSRGFGFVEMTTEAEAATLLAGLQDKEHDGRKLVVADAPASEVKKFVGRR
ncbi:MAG: RNA-binding protein [Bdellovibrionota bacterium]